MKLLVAVFLVALVFASNPNEILDYESLANSVNAKGVSWKASAEAVPPQFRQMTNGDLSGFFTSVDMGLAEAAKKASLITRPACTSANLYLPTSFSWKNNITGWANVRDQGQCGSCWAFASTTTLSARRVLKTGEPWLALSPQDLLNCDQTCLPMTGGGCDNACKSGTMPNVWHYLGVTGVAPDSCLPYRETGNTCTSLCTSGSTKTTYTASDSFFGMTPDEMKFLIFRDGPIQTLMQVYDDFYTYSSGIYVRSDGEKKGGHSVTIIGWGEEDGKQYWLAQNSWGPAWGESGYFRVAIDNNGCDFGAVGGAGAPGSFNRVSSRFAVVNVSDFASLKPVCNFDTSRVMIYTAGLGGVDNAFRAADYVVRQVASVPDMASFDCRRHFIPVTDDGFLKPVCYSTCTSYYRNVLQYSEGMAKWQCDAHTKTMWGPEIAAEGDSLCSADLIHPNVSNIGTIILIVVIVLGVIIAAVVCIVLVVFHLKKKKRMAYNAMASRNMVVVDHTNPTASGAPYTAAPQGQQGVAVQGVAVQGSEPAVTLQIGLQPGQQNFVIQPGMPTQSYPAAAAPVYAATVDAQAPSL